MSAIVGKRRRRYDEVYRVNYRGRTERSCARCFQWFEVLSGKFGKFAPWRSRCSECEIATQSVREKKQIRRALDIKQLHADRIAGIVNVGELDVVDDSELQRIIQPHRDTGDDDGLE